jgi:hypothetical protein
MGTNLIKYWHLNKATHRVYSYKVYKVYTKYSMPACYALCLGMEKILG